MNKQATEKIAGEQGGNRRQGNGATPLGEGIMKIPDRALRGICNSRDQMLAAQLAPPPGTGAKPKSWEPWAAQEGSKKQEPKPFSEKELADMQKRAFRGRHSY